MKRYNLLVIFLLITLMLPMSSCLEENNTIDKNALKICDYQYIDLTLENYKEYINLNYDVEKYNIIEEENNSFYYKYDVSFVSISEEYEFCNVIIEFNIEEMDISDETKIDEIMQLDEKGSLEFNYETKRFYKILHSCEPKIKDITGKVKLPIDYETE